MDIKIEQSWKHALEKEFGEPYFIELTRTMRNKYMQKETIYPPPQYIFNAFSLCPFNAVRVVILGQDPYHGKGQAHGLCFSVPDAVPLPPSLQNVYKEIESDVGTKPQTTGDLTHWAAQGVLLLNATLTVKANQPGSHQGLGWEQFTDAVIQKLSIEKEHLVFLLWGKYAQQKGRVIDASKHLILKAAHPSPFSAHSGFFGCKHFSATNRYLEKHGKSPIVW